MVYYVYTQIVIIYIYIYVVYFLKIFVGICPNLEVIKNII